MENYIVRSIDPLEYHILKDLTYEAIFQKDITNPVPRNILLEPEIKVFYENFGKKDDYCFVAEVNRKIIGAVWVRLINGNVKGFGNIDSSTPEFAISLYKEYRNLGIGTKLMKTMLDFLKKTDYKKVSLAVQKENYAFDFYKHLGFEVLKETEEEYIMLYKL